MKYIVLVVGLLVMGCGEVENGAYKHRPKQTDTNESTPSTNTNKVDGTTAKPVKELTLEEKLVGTYEAKSEGHTFKLFLLENDVFEYYKNGKKREEDYKWSISEDGELHVIEEDGDIGVYRINKDGSLTLIARIVEGKREEAPKEYQFTAKKIK